MCEIEIENNPSIIYSQILNMYCKETGTLYIELVKILAAYNNKSSC